MTARFKSVGIAAAICAVASLLIFANLGRSLLWEDEAQTALLARTTLRYGVPTGHDGANSLSQEEGRDIDAHGVFRYHPWAQFYIAAASFALFGESTVTARLPFAVLGVATVALTYLVARFVWRSDAAAAAAALLLTFSVPFLLLVRQCRYYSPLAFFLLLAVFAYFHMLQGRRGYIVLFVAAAVATMHTLHIYALAFLACASLHTLVLHRDRWKLVLIPSIAIVVLHIPWFRWVFEVAQYNHKQTLGGTASLTGWFLWQAALYVVTPATVFAWVLVFVLSKRSQSGQPPLDSHQRSAAAFFVMLICASVLCVGMRAPAPFFRYLAPLPPIGALLFAPAIPRLFARGRLWGTAAVVATVLWLLWGGKLIEYRYEVFTPYRGPIRGMAEYLNANAKPGDTVVLAYGDMPLKFYTNLRVVGGLTGEDLAPGRGARFIVARRFLITAACIRVNQFLAGLLASQAYEPIALDCPDLPWENREDLASHVFAQPTGADPVMIFKRRE